MEEFAHRKGFNKSKLSLVLLFLVILFFVVYSLWLNPAQNAATTEARVNTNGYQVIFLENKEEYFGKLTVENRFYILRDVYYLKTGKAAQSKEDSQGVPQIQLVKLGNVEIHAPEDAMYIEREHVLYWENLKDTSDIVKTIKRHKTQPQTPPVAPPVSDKN